jgi:uncharacterized repeat protein (TIGR01451 family)
MRKNWSRRKLHVAFLLILFLFLSLATRPADRIAPDLTSKSHSENQPLKKPESRNEVRNSTSASSVLGNMPVSFEPAVEANTYLVRGSGYRLSLTSSQVSIALRNRMAGEEVVRMSLAGADREAKGIALEELPGKRNYLIGKDPRKWRTNVPTYARIRYAEIYAGINVTYYGNPHQLEYDFEVAPGADSRQIKLTFNSRARPRISAAGELLLQAGEGELRQHRPVAYQEIDGERKLVEAGYVLGAGNQVAFEVGSYDRSRTLVIDPTLVYSTYLGAGGNDTGSSIAVDQNNNVYVTGTTASTTFPTQNPAFANNAGLADIFVTKIDATGGTIVYSTYVGGHGNDRAGGITVDQAGNAYVVGRVDAESINFPTTPGALATTYRGGDFDGVVFKLNPTGSGLVYSTFVGGEENDSAEGIAIDSSGNAYVVGGARSQSFPTTVTAYQASGAGDTDGYLLKFNASGSSLLYGTMIGGTGTDRGSGVAIDSSGNAYVAGFCASQDFPTVNAFQNSPAGGFEAFVAKIDTNSSGPASLVFCSYLGGGADDKAYGIAIDSTGSSVYVTGQSSSNNFPLLSPAQPGFGGSFDAFITKISSAGAKVYATYLGGSGDDRALGVAVNSAGEAYLTGYTSSTNFPTVTPLQIANGGGFDAFVAKLNAAGSAFLYSTYLGGNANENTVPSVTTTNPLALGSSNSAYITGYTSSTNFPTALPLQSANGGLQDVFVARISDVTSPADYTLSVLPGSRTVGPGSGTTYTVTATPAGGFTGTISLAVNGLSGDSTSSFSPPTIVITDASAKSSTLTVNTNVATPPGTYSLTVTSTSGNLQHSSPIQLIVSGVASANLALTKTASPNPGISLANLTYRITVTNNGASPATNVTVTDNLPVGPAFVSATPTQGSCTGTSTVTCNLGAISSGALAIVNIIVTPQSTLQLSNTASVSATETDPDLNNNSATIQTTVNAPSSGPTMLDPSLSVQTVVTGLSQPTSMAFIANNDFFVLEKNTGKVQRVINGAIQSPAPLDLAVNSASERGMLGIALHPNFAFNGYVYLFWTESNTAADTTNVANVPLLGNRVDRYLWNGSTLTFDRNLIKLRAYQADANQQLRGNHNGGILRFGPDGKLYILMGDNGRRGLLQNNLQGPAPDDQYGGPEPDDNHLTGFILRLNDDGSTPSDNPFFNVATPLAGEAAANIKKLFAYGVRNGFGMGFDPLSGNLWNQENGDDAFDEMNRITAGSNNGWIQMMGPNSRVAEFKQIESTYGAGDLQQLRWPPSLIANTPAAALAALYTLPGSHYNDPEFSWKYAVAPSPLGFVQGRGIGPQFEGDMFVGAARTFLSGGYLFRLRLTSDRLHFLFNDSRLNDLVADNADKFDITESETLLIGKDFGITTDIQTGPNGDLYVVSNVAGAVYRISGTPPSLFVADLNGAQNVPPTNSPATGTATILLNADQSTARVSLNFGGLLLPQTSAHIHGPAAVGSNGATMFALPIGQFSDLPITLTAQQVQDLQNGLVYIDLHNSSFTGTEIRGQFGASSSASSVQFSAANYLVSESAGRATITFSRIGDTTAPASVDYATADTAGSNNCSVTNGIASSRCDYTTTIGKISFAAGEKLKTVDIPLTDDVYAEGNENFTIALSNPAGTALGSPGTATITITDNESTTGTNPIDASDFFVHQHYIDFLNREPDPAGFAFWVNEIAGCSPQPQCVEAKRINVSGSFFLSIEFQQTGYLVERIYKASYGDVMGTSTLGGPHQLSVPVVRFNEFLGGTQQIGEGVIVNQGNWQQQLESNKQAFTAEFVQSSRFLTEFPTSMTPAQFVDKLNANAGNPLSVAERNQLVAELGSSTKTRAQVLRAVAEDPDLVNAEFNRAFVLMQYFGYLRRNPNDPQDTDYTGYDFWLTKLNQFNGSFTNAEMVKAFLSSIEYRQRFGP